ncbi:hypothetical protein [Undibacterium terreum]|uniref:Uncharacterized protein n=1 Tax=Undibacterium terreum TaxID=1224302 RepID=A0A916UM05_9BURK|nr:hypothetical protein [Undibacterium terreum]GGC78293.1 hypothetical protein GCM10011396_26870 [Undibacterium terreum]
MKDPETSLKEAPTQIRMQAWKDLLPSSKTPLCQQKSDMESAFHGFWLNAMSLQSMVMASVVLTRADCDKFTEKFCSQSFFLRCMDSPAHAGPPPVLAEKI